MKYSVAMAEKITKAVITQYNLAGAGHDLGTAFTAAEAIVREIIADTHRVLSLEEDDAVDMVAEFEVPA